MLESPLERPPSSGARPEHLVLGNTPGCDLLHAYSWRHGADIARLPAFHGRPREARWPALHPRPPIRVEHLLDLLAADWTAQDIQAEFPFIEPDDIREALKYAAALAHREFYLPLAESA